MNDNRDASPAADLPDAIGKTAALALSLHGVASLQHVAEHSAKELLAIHGVGPKAVRVLGEALEAQGLAFSQSE